MPARSDLAEPGVAWGSRRPERGAEIGGCFAELRQLCRPEPPPSGLLAGVWSIPTVARVQGPRPAVWIPTTRTPP